ncbi:MAG: membrane protein insertion efficiency factor YidD [Clostridia bacterium]|nr:membrane protein insertion efficiency factor YidD [Clostridia bacterium]
MKQTGKSIWNSVRTAAGQLHTLLCRLVLLPVYLYRKFISPLKGHGSCRFTPTCSRYCIDAIMEWGILIGLALTVWRILRCNPFSPGGEDPVPENPLRRGRGER